MVATVVAYAKVPKGFFPQQDTGRINGSIQADQATSFQAMRPKLATIVNTIMKDPGVESASGFLGGNASSGRIFVGLKPREERTASADEIIARLRRQLSGVPGATLYLQPVQDVRVPSKDGSLVPLDAVTRLTPSTAHLTVNHSGQFPSVTLSFNLPVGVAAGDAVDAVDRAEREMGLPATIRGISQGTAQAFQQSLANEPLLIAAALFAVYVVLGVLYESLIHPVTILSTLPSAGVGALVALLVTGNDRSVIALIGIILLIGIVKKNAILRIDFAIEAERRDHRGPEDAIFKACLLRFRPITMTTMAALLGGLPLALGSGTSAELRRPLGITIVGGLLLSRMLTLDTTPVVSLYLDRMRLRRERLRWRGPVLVPAGGAA